MSVQSSASPRLPEPGDLFAGRYRLQAKLAAGGMGAVFEAVDVETERDVAIKLLHPELVADPEIRRRFRRESSVLAALDHPAVVRVFDVGTDDGGRAYTVMELLRGETLEERIRRDAPLAPASLVDVVRGICDGLRAAHEHGVLHGDLKPANVFLADGPSGTAVKLVDFGLSKVHGLERLTRTGEIIGTPAYMAPELLTGEGEIDERIDTYAIGVILYEALAGRKAFTERNPGRLILVIATGQAEPLTTVNPAVSAPLAEVVSRAMSKDRSNRYRTSDELAAAWEAAVASAK